MIPLERATPQTSDSPKPHSQPGREVGGFQLAPYPPFATWNPPPSPPGELKASNSEVSHDQAVAKIRGNRHFSVDIFRIKAYYWIVKMGTATVASDSGGRKAAFPISRFLNFVLFGGIAPLHHYISPSASVRFRPPQSRPIKVNQGKEKRGVFMTRYGKNGWFAGFRTAALGCNAATHSKNPGNSLFTVLNSPFWPPFRGKSNEVTLHEPFTAQIRVFQIQANQA